MNTFCKGTSFYCGSSCSYFASSLFFKVTPNALPCLGFVGSSAPLDLISSFGRSFAYFSCTCPRPALGAPSVYFCSASFCSLIAAASFAYALLAAACGVSFFSSSILGMDRCTSLKKLTKNSKNLSLFCLISSLFLTMSRSSASTYLS